MIRPQLLQQVRQALGESGYFDADDFVVETKTAGIETTLSISCRFSNDFSLTARIAKRRGSNISIDVEPGAITQLDSLAVDDWDHVIAEIRAWRSRIVAELKAQPTARQVDAQRQELEKLLATIGKVEDKYFSQEEAAELRGKLDALEVTLADQIKESNENEAQLEKKLASLHADITALKESLDSLKKKGWAQRAAVRVGKWMGDPVVREALKTGTEVVKGLLKPGS